MAKIFGRLGKKAQKFQFELQLSGVTTSHELGGPLVAVWHRGTHSATSAPSEAPVLSNGQYEARWVNLTDKKIDIDATLYTTKDGYLKKKSVLRFKSQGSGEVFGEVEFDLGRYASPVPGQSYSANVDERLHKCQDRLAYCKFVIVCNATSAMHQNVGKIGSQRHLDQLKNLDMWLSDAQSAHKTVEFMFDKADANNRGKISRADGEKILVQLAKNSGLDEPSGKPLRRLWKDIDARNSLVTRKQVSDLVTAYARQEKKRLEEPADPADHPTPPEPLSAGQGGQVTLQHQHQPLLRERSSRRRRIEFGKDADSKEAEEEVKTTTSKKNLNHQHPLWKTTVDTAWTCEGNCEVPQKKAKKREQWVCSRGCAFVICKECFGQIKSPKKTELWRDPGFQHFLCKDLGKLKNDWKIPTSAAAKNFSLDTLSKMIKLSLTSEFLFDKVGGDFVGAVNTLTSGFATMQDVMRRSENFPNSQTKVGMSAFIDDFIRRISELPADDFIIWDSPSFSCVFIIERDSKTEYTFCVCTNSPTLLAFHPSSCTQYPSHRVQTVLRFPGISKSAIADPSLLFFLFGGISNSSSSSMLYDIIVPHLIRGSKTSSANKFKYPIMNVKPQRAGTGKVHSNNMASLPSLFADEAKEIDAAGEKSRNESSLEQYETMKMDLQKRNDAGKFAIFWLNVLSATRYLIRRAGLSLKQQKQFFFALRYSYLCKVKQSAARLQTISESDRLLILNSCRQARRHTDKSVDRDSLSDSALATVTSTIQELETSVYELPDSDLDSRKKVTILASTPYSHFRGFDFVADSRDTDEFVDGPIEEEPGHAEVSIQDTSALSSVHAIFSKIRNCQAKIFQLRAKVSLSSDAIVNHQIAALVERFFLFELPIPLPRATPAAIFKCPYSTARNVSLETQRASLSALLEIACNYTAAALSTENSKSREFASRAITMGCILAIADAILRIQASPIASAVSIALVEDHNVFSGTESSFGRSFTVSGYWLPFLKLDEATEHTLCMSPEALTARSAVTRYFKESQEAKAATELFVWNNRAASNNKAAESKSNDEDDIFSKFSKVVVFRGGKEKHAEFKLSTRSILKLQRDHSTLQFTHRVLELLNMQDAAPDEGSYTTESQRLAAWLAAPWEMASEFAVYRDLHALYRLCVSHTNYDYQKTMFVADVRPQWTAPPPPPEKSGDMNKATEQPVNLNMNFSYSVSLGQPAKDVTSPTTYQYPVGEEEILHFNTTAAVFDNTIHPEEVERIMMFLTAPYLRIPLILEFFAQDRVSTLVNMKLRTLLEHCLLQPLKFTSETARILTVPVGKKRKAKALGTLHGALYDELEYSPSSVLHPLLKLLHGAVKLCAAGWNSIFVPVLLFCTRIAYIIRRVTLDIAWRNKASTNKHIFLPETKFLLQKLDSFFSVTANLLVKWANQAEQARKKDESTYMHAHVVITKALILLAKDSNEAEQDKSIVSDQAEAEAEDKPVSPELEDAIKAVLSSAGFVFSMYRRDMRFPDFPIHEVFQALQFSQGVISRYLARSSPKAIDTLINAMVERTLGGSLSGGSREDEEKHSASQDETKTETAVEAKTAKIPRQIKNWEPVTAADQPQFVEYWLASSHPYQLCNRLFYKVHFPGVKNISLYFSDLCYVHATDFITIFKDESHSSFWGEKERLTSLGPWPGAGGRNPLVIPSDHFILMFSSVPNSTQAPNRYGFQVLCRAPVSESLAAQLASETKFKQSVCAAALGATEHKYAEACKWLRVHGKAAAIDESKQGTLVKVEGLYRNAEGTLQINLKTAEVYIQSKGALRELPPGFHNHPTFQKIWSGKSATEFRCSIKSKDRNREQIMFQSNDATSNAMRWYEVTKWKKYAYKKQEWGLFALITEYQKGGMQNELEFAKNDLGGLASQGWHNFPSRAKAGGKLTFMGRRYILYSQGDFSSLGFSEEYTKMCARADKLFFYSDANNRVLKTMSLFVTEEDTSDPAPVLRMLMHFRQSDNKSTPGQFMVYQQDHAGTSNLYALQEINRKAQLKLVFCSDLRTSMKDLARRSPLLAHAPFACGNLYSAFNMSESLNVKRDSTLALGLVDRFCQSEGEVESFVPTESLMGTLPDSLLNQYAFWRTGELMIRGYPISDANETQLLIELRLELAFELPNGETFRCVCAPTDTSEAVMADAQRAAAKQGKDFSKSTFSKVASGGKLRKGKLIEELGIGTWVSRVRRVRFERAKDRKQRDGSSNAISGETGELLLNLSTGSSSPKSPLGRIVRLFRNFESLSHMLVWSSSLAQLGGEECEISTVELPRLRLTFLLKQHKEQVRLYSVDYDGLYIDTSNNESTRKWANKLEHALVLTNEKNQPHILIPNFGLQRINASRREVATKLVFDRTANWSSKVSTKYYIYPVHSSGAFLITSSLASRLYLIILRLMTRQYSACAELISACSPVQSFNAEEAWIMGHVAKTVDDPHPNACGLRLQLAIFGGEKWAKSASFLKTDVPSYMSKRASVGVLCRVTMKEEAKLSRWVGSSLAGSANSTYQKYLRCVKSGSEFLVPQMRPPANLGELKHFINQFVERHSDILRQESGKELGAVFDSQFMTFGSAKEFFNLTWENLIKHIEKCLTNLERERQALLKQAEALTKGEEADEHEVIDEVTIGKASESETEREAAWQDKKTKHVEKKNVSDSVKEVLTDLYSYILKFRNAQESVAGPSGAKWTCELLNTFDHSVEERFHGRRKNQHGEETFPVAQRMAFHFKKPERSRRNGDAALAYMRSNLNASYKFFPLLYQLIRGQFSLDFSPTAAEKREYARWFAEEDDKQDSGEDDDAQEEKEQEDDEDDEEIGQEIPYVCYWCEKTNTKNVDKCFNCKSELDLPIDNSEEATPKPVANLPFLDMLIKYLVVTQGSKQETAYLRLFIAAKKLGQDSLFPAFPYSKNKFDLAKSSCSEFGQLSYFAKKLFQAAVDVSNPATGRWLPTPNGYIFKKLENFWSVKVDTKGASELWVRPSTANFSCSRRVLNLKNSAAQPQLSLPEVKAAEMAQFCHQPLISLLDDNILWIKPSLSRPLLKALPFAIPEVMTPPEESYLLNMQDDLAKSATVKQYPYLKSLTPQDLEVLRDTSVKDDAKMKILPSLLKQLDKLEQSLALLQSEDSKTASELREAVELACAPQQDGARKLFNQQGLKFERMVAALLSTEDDIRIFNPKLSVESSSLILQRVSAALFYSVRRGQITTLRGKIRDLCETVKKLLAAQLEAHFVPQQTAGGHGWMAENDRPVALKQMLSKALEQSSYDLSKARKSVERMQDAQQRLFKTLHKEHKMPKMVASHAAAIITKLVDFDESKFSKYTDTAEALVDLAQRDCFFGGQKLNAVPLSITNTFAGSQSLNSIIHVIEHAASDVASLLTSRRGYIEPTKEEGAQATEASVFGRKDDIDQAEAVQFDPRFLVFEYLVNFMMRPRQVDLVLQFFDSARGGSSLVAQMIMGAGKSTVIAPLLAVMLTNGDNLVTLIVPKALLDMSHRVLVSIFSNIMIKSVEVFEFNRGIKNEQAALLYDRVNLARRMGNIVVTTPESVKSMMLKYLDLLQLESTANPALSLPRASLGTKYLWKEVERQGKDFSGPAKLADTLAKTLKLWRNKGIALLDEVDMLLHPLKSELNFPIGQPETLSNMTDRYSFPLFLFDAFFFSSLSPPRTIHKCSEAERETLEALARAITRGERELSFQTLPHRVLLRKEFYHAHMKRLFARWSLSWLSRHKVVEAELKVLNVDEGLGGVKKIMESLENFLCTKRFTDDSKFVSDRFSEDAIERLLMARDWVCSLLPHCLSKINRVDYGLLQTSVHERWVREGEKKEAQSESRVKCAVPFVGKDVPSRRSEFAHPEVLIGLTILAARYEGLRTSNMDEVINRLRMQMQREPGPYPQRRSRILFQDWVDMYNLQFQATNTDEDAYPVSILPLELFPPKTDGAQMEDLMGSLAKLPEVIEFWMSGIAFPNVLKYQRRKLQASGVDLGSQILFQTRLGFSGTPSDLVPLDLGKCDFELGSQAQVIRVMTDQRLMSYFVMDRSWTVEQMLEKVAKREPPVHALIDTGALVTGMSNEEVANFLLRSGLKGMDACVYLDESDRKMVLDRDGISVPFERCGLAPERRFTFFDQVHTTGMDIKQGIDACAVATLGKDVTLRDHAQGIWRMRGLGRGQSVQLAIVPEVLELVRGTVRNSSGNFSAAPEGGASAALPDEGESMLVYVLQWLISNSMQSTNQQFLALTQQDLHNVWRKNAFAKLVESQFPPEMPEYVFQQRFQYFPGDISEGASDAILDEHPLMEKNAFMALLDQYDVDITISLHQAGDMAGARPTVDSEQVKRKNKGWDSDKAESLQSHDTRVNLKTEEMKVEAFLEETIGFLKKKLKDVSNEQIKLWMMNGQLKLLLVTDKGDILQVQKDDDSPALLKDYDALCHPKHKKLEMRTTMGGAADGKISIFEMQERMIPHVNLRIICTKKLFETMRPVFTVAKKMMSLFSKWTQADVEVRIDGLDDIKDGEEDLDLEGKDAEEEEEAAPLLSTESADRLTHSMGIFCEVLPLDLEKVVKASKPFNEVLRDLVEERKDIVESEEAAKSLELLVERVAATEDALRKKAELLRKAGGKESEDDGQNLDTELVQESEKELEIEEQLKKNEGSNIKFAPPARRRKPWRVIDLSSAAGMLDDNFFSINDLSAIEALQYPPHLLLSQAFLPLINSTRLARKLKNVTILMYWEPMHDGLDRAGGTEQLLQLIEGEFSNNGKDLVRLMLEGVDEDDEGTAGKANLAAPNEQAEEKKDGKERQLATHEHKPFVVALTLEEAQTLRFVVRKYMAENSPAVGDNKLLEGSFVSLCTLDGLWLTDTIEESKMAMEQRLQLDYKEPVKLENVLMNTDQFQPSNLDTGRHCFRFFNNSLGFKKDEVLLLMKAFKNQPPELLKNSYAQIVRCRRRARDDVTDTFLDILFNKYKYTDLAFQRDFAIRVRQEMKRKKVGFVDWDEDGSWSLTRVELHKALHDLLGEGIETNNHIETLVQYTDEDNDGEISYREFMSVFAVDEAIEFEAPEEILEAKKKGFEKRSAQQANLQHQQSLGLARLQRQDSAKKTKKPTEALTSVEEHGLAASPKAGAKPSYKRLHSMASGGKTKKKASGNNHLGARAHTAWNRQADIMTLYPRCGGNFIFGNFGDEMIHSLEAPGFVVTACPKAVDITLGDYFYEVRVKAPGAAQLGWADFDFFPDRTHGVGNCTHSWALSSAGQALQGGKENSPAFVHTAKGVKKAKGWQKGDVVGCRISLQASGYAALFFTLNGQPVTGSKTAKPTEPLFALEGYTQGIFPAVTLGQDFLARLDLGYFKRFAYPPPLGVNSVLDWAMGNIDILTALTTTQGGLFSPVPALEAVIQGKKFDIYTQAISFLSLPISTGRFYFELYVLDGFSNVSSLVLCDFKNNQTMPIYFGSKTRQISKGHVVGVHFDSQHMACTMFLDGVKVNQRVALAPFVRKTASYRMQCTFSLRSASVLTVVANLGQKPFKFPPSDSARPLDQWLDEHNIFSVEETEAEEEARVANLEVAEQELMELRSRRKRRGRRRQKDAENRQAEEDEDLSSSSDSDDDDSMATRAKEVELEVVEGACGIDIDKYAYYPPRRDLLVTAYSLGGLYGSIRARASVASGRWYYEVRCGYLLSTKVRFVVGWAASGLQFEPDHRHNKGVGDVPYSWGLQVYQSPCKTTGMPFSTRRETAKHQKALVAAKKQEQRQLQLEEVRRKAKEKLAMPIMDLDDEVQPLSDDEKEEKVADEETDVKVAPKAAKMHDLAFAGDLKSQDMIGCALDLDAMEMRFSLNGEWMENLTIKMPGKVSGLALSPAASLSSTAYQTFFNFGPYSKEKPPKYEGRTTTQKTNLKYPIPKNHHAFNLYSEAAALQAKKPAQQEKQTPAKKKTKQDKGKSSKARGNKARGNKANQKAKKTWNSYGANDSEDGKKLLLWDRPRTARRAWKRFLDEANNIERRIESPELSPSLALYGDLMSSKMQLSKRVMTFLSSTFTDTSNERNILISDVYPFLRYLASKIGFEYVPMEMRWGIREEDTDSHKTFDICMNAIDRCHANSRGVAFILILGDKYGYRPFPAEIDTDEFGRLHRAANSNTKQLMEEWFVLNENIVPPSHQLKALSNETRGVWWGKQNDGVFFQLMWGLREAAFAAEFDKAMRERYEVSVTEGEVNRGIMNFSEPLEGQEEDINPALRKTLVFERRLQNIPSKEANKVVSSFKDTNDGAQEMLAKLRAKLSDLRERTAMPAQQHKLFQEEWNPESGISIDTHASYLRRFSNYFCEFAARDILKQGVEYMREAGDEVLQEAKLHNEMCKVRAENFTGRDPQLKAIARYIQNTNRQPLILYGRSGCGKTSLMARAALQVSELQERFLCVRFCGASQSSATAADLMRSLCLHLGRIYSLNNQDLPFDFARLRQLFILRLTSATSSCPLVIFIDSLDQLFDADQGRDLRWLPRRLPQHVRMVLSSIGHPQATAQRRDPILKPYEALRKRGYPDSAFIHLQGMEASATNGMIRKWQAASKVTTTEQQFQVLTSVEATDAQLPLYRKLAFDISKKWHSSHIAKPLKGTVHELVTRIFIEIERYGASGPASLSYITVARLGLSDNELEDILSLDDTVLDDTFQFWTPPVYRIPPVIWTLIKGDMKDYLVEKAAHGVSAFNWFHRQFREVAEKLWLSDPEVRCKRCSLLADYFMGKYAHGKALTVVKGKQVTSGSSGRSSARRSSLAREQLLDRRINPQSLVVAESAEVGRASRRYNTRRLIELPYALIGARRWTELAETLCDFEFIVGMCTELSVMHLREVFEQSIAALKSVETPTDENKQTLHVLEDYFIFLSQSSQQIMAKSSVVFALAANQPDSSNVCQRAMAWYKSLEPLQKVPWLRRVHKPQTLHPCTTTVRIGKFVSAAVFNEQGTQLAIFYGSAEMQRKCSLKCYNCASCSLKLFSVAKDSHDLDELVEYKYHRPSTLDLRKKSYFDFWQSTETIDWKGDRLLLPLVSPAVIDATTGKMLSSLQIPAIGQATTSFDKVSFGPSAERVLGIFNPGFRNKEQFCCAVWDTASGDLLAVYQDALTASLGPKNMPMAVVRQWYQPDLEKGAAAYAPRFRENQECLCRFKGGSFSYPAVVFRVMQEAQNVAQKNLYWIIYDDGDVEKNVPEHLLSHKVEGGELVLRTFNISDSDVAKAEGAEEMFGAEETVYEKGVMDVAYHPDGKFLCASASAPFRLVAYKAQDSKLTRSSSVDLPTQPFSVKFIGQGTRLISFTTCSIEMLGIDQNGGLQRIFTMSLNRMTSIVNVAHSRLGVTVACGGHHETISKWDEMLAKRLPGAAVMEAEEGGEEQATQEGGVFTRLLGDTLQLDVDGEWSLDGEKLFTLTLDLRNELPVSIIRDIPYKSLDPPVGEPVGPVRHQIRIAPPPPILGKNSTQSVNKELGETTVVTETSNWFFSSSQSARILTTTSRITRPDRTPGLIAISPNERYVALGGSANTFKAASRTYSQCVNVQLHLRENGSLIQLLPLDQEDSQATGSQEVAVCKFSPDNRMLAVGYKNLENVYVWDVSNAYGKKTAKKYSIAGHGGCQDLVFSRDSKSIISIANQVLACWESSTGEMIAQLNSKHHPSVVAISNSPEKLIAIGTEKGRVLVYTLEEQELSGGSKGGNKLTHAFKKFSFWKIKTKTGEFSEIQALSFLGSSEYLVVCYDKVVSIWKPSAQMEVSRYYISWQISKISVSKEGVIAIFGHDSISPWLLKVEGLNLFPMMIMGRLAVA